ncbi:MAG TPA: glycosyltransferase family 2 protein [Acidimicrobiales bacterium]|nr:glycosyltransferase family 2 protein [Acidimicrobiales bacterium]
MTQTDVVVVTYGGATDLPGCIAGVRAQGSAIGRVIVVDNASPDDVVAVARSLGGLEIIENRENIGYAAAMNLALGRSETPFVLSLNADCVLEPGYVDACVKMLESDERLAGVTGMLVLPDGRADSTGFDVSSAMWATERDRHRPPDQLRPSSEPFGVSGAAALWRRAALEDLGPAPWWQWLFVYWDDVELCWRARRRGWTFAFVGGARAVHRRGADTADSVFVEGQSFRNRLATIARHRGWPGLVAPASLLVTVVVAIRLAVRHPAALRAAHPVVAVRAGLAARRCDTSIPDRRVALARHPWTTWFAAQLRPTRAEGAPRGS